VEATQVWGALVERFRRATGLTRPPAKWFLQRRGQPWRAATRQEFASLVHGHLRARHWAGVWAPQDGVVEELSLDLDAKSEAERQTRDARYRRVRKIVGQQHVPLVVQTPNGGLHVRYRLPPTRLIALHTGRTSGLVASVLQAHGLAPIAGQLELFPQKNQALRLPLGARMARC